jgi:hypothetical protein
MVGTAGGVAAGRVAVELNTIGNDGDGGGGKLEALTDEVGVEAAGGEEEIRIADTVVEGGPAAGAIGFGEAVEEGVFALEEGDDGGAEAAFELGGEAGEEGIGEADHVGALDDGEPLHEFI